MRLFRMTHPGITVPRIISEKILPSYDSNWTRTEILFEEEPFVHLDWLRNHDTKANAVWMNQFNWFPQHAEHFAHCQTGDKWELVSYYENKEKAARRVVNRIKPGKYVEKYFKGHYDPAAIAARWRTQFGPVELKIAQTAKEIKKVYMGGPSSCMKHQNSVFKTKPPVHPTAVYGEGSDLAVAYTTRDGKINSRAVVWPDKKIYGRIYGDKTALYNVLHKAGYTEGTFIGAKLAKIEHGMGYVMAYVDNHSYGVVRDDHIEIVARSKKGDKVVHIQQQQGGWNVGTLCQKLNRMVADDTIRSVRVDARRSEMWSLEAIKEFGFTCEATRQVWSNEFKLDVEGKSVNSFATTYYFICQGLNKAFKVENKVSLSKGDFSREYIRDRIKTSNGEKAAA